MLNRIKLILKEKGLTPSSFADKIQVSRGAISHILNGRNEPSKDTIDKILNAFPDISKSWLWDGTGPMYNTTNTINERLSIKPDPSPGQLDLFNVNKAVDSPVKPQAQENPPKTDVKEPEIKPNPIEIQQINLSNNISKKIDKIIIFFTDKTFMTFISED